MINIQNFKTIEDYLAVPLDDVYLPLLAQIEEDNAITVDSIYKHGASLLEILAATMKSYVDDYKFLLNKFNKYGVKAACNKHINEIIFFCAYPNFIDIPNRIADGIVFLIFLLDNLDTSSTTIASFRNLEPWAERAGISPSITYNGEILYLFNEAYDPMNPDKYVRETILILFDTPMNIPEGAIFTTPVITWKLLDHGLDIPEYADEYVVDNFVITL